MHPRRLFVVIVALVTVLGTADCKTQQDPLGPVPKDEQNLQTAPHYPAPGTLIPIEGVVEDITWMDSLLPFVNRRVGLVVSSTGALYRASGGGQGWQLIGRPGKGADIATSRLPKVSGFIAGTSGRQHWLTQDGGETFSQINTTLSLYAVVFHPHQAGWALAHTGGPQCSTKPGPECGLAVTLTSGSSWKALNAQGIRFPYFAWTARFSRAVGDMLSSLGNEIMGTTPKMNPPQNMLGVVAVVARKDGTTLADCNIVRSNDMLKTSQVILQYACEFVILNGKIFSIRKGVLWTATAEEGAFKEARLPVKVYPLALLSIFHDKSHFLMVAPNDGSKAMELSTTTPSGILLKSNQDGTAWKQVLSDCHLIKAEKPIPHLRGDVHILDGLHGVYLANQIHKRAGIAAGGGELTGNVAYTTQTLVTVDSGRSWSPLSPPSEYPQGVSFSCSPAKNDCSLNIVLHKKIANSMPVWTTHDYPGYILAAGALGKEQDTTDLNGLFQSNDAGRTWTIVTDHLGMGLFSSLGHGEGTAVVTQTGNRPAVSYYSGQGREEAKVVTPDFKASFVATGDNGNSQTPSLLVTGTGSTGLTGAVFFEFRPWPKPCIDDDFEEWRLGGAAEVLWAGCILGHTLDCSRKRVGRECYVTNRETRLKCKKKDCDCSIRDYECIPGYERKYTDDGIPAACSFRSGFGKTPEEEEQRQALSRLFQGNASIDSVCNVLKSKELTVPSGYNLYPGDTCLHKRLKSFHKCVADQKRSISECSSQYKVYESVPADCPVDVPSVTAPISTPVANRTNSDAKTKLQIPTMLTVTPMHSPAKEVFWLGEDSSVALALTLDRSVYISQNYGKSWKELVLPLKPGLSLEEESYVFLEVEGNTTTSMAVANADFDLALAEQMKKLAIHSATKAVASEESAMKDESQAETIQKVAKRNYKKDRHAAAREELEIQPSTSKQAVSAVVHVKSDKSRAFIIGRHHTHWLTKDGGKSFLPISTKHRLRGVKLHPTRPNCILAVTVAHRPKLLLSEDGGATWRGIASNVFYPHYDWIITASTPDVTEQICAITKRKEILSSHTRIWDPEHDLVCFEYVPKDGTMRNSLQVLHANLFFASQKYITAAAAPTTALGPITLHIGVLPTDKKAIVVQSINFPTKHSIRSLEFIQPDNLHHHLFVLGSVSKHKGILFHVDLRKATISTVLQDVALLSNMRNSLIYTGLPGRYMANVFAKANKENQIADGTMKSMVTVDYGKHWKPVHFNDSDFALDFQSGFKTTSSTPGIQLATGSVQQEGRFLGPGSTLMLSMDGGCTWRSVYHMHSCDNFWGKEYDIFGDRPDEKDGCLYQYAVGNHGDTLVAIESHALSNQVHVSHNQGRNWEAVTLPKSSFSAQTVFGPPSEAAEVYILSGISTSMHAHNDEEAKSASSGELVYLNVSVPAQRRCFGETNPGKLGSDFKLWEPWSDEVVKLFDNITGFNQKTKCFFGQRSRYVRRAKMRTLCAVLPGVTFEIALETDCKCSAADYECIDDKVGYCVPPTSMSNNIAETDLCALGGKRPLLGGYHRVDSSRCTAGLSLSSGPTKCTFDNHDTKKAQKGSQVQVLHPPHADSTRPTKQTPKKPSADLNKKLGAQQKTPSVSGQSHLVIILLVFIGFGVASGAALVYFKMQKAVPNVDDSHKYECVGDASYPHSAIDDMIDGILDESDQTIDVDASEFNQAHEAEQSVMAPLGLSPVEKGSLSESLANKNK